VKIIDRRSFGSDPGYEREFSDTKDFEPISRSHAGLMGILQVGRNDREGYFYYVMELADDISVQTVPLESALNTYSPKTLYTELRRRGTLPAAECLEWALLLAGALGQLHKRGLVHRDVKPSNIFFVNGQPKLTGIATTVKSIHGGPTFIGTEGFAPPEGPGSPQADLYSLGKVLYEISTGQDRNEFPALPTREPERPDRERVVKFREVILKACQNEPQKRYQNADEMLADIARLLTSAKSNEPRPRIPDHELLRPIGGGSYGEVWLAKNVMGSFRAVKVVYRKTFESERPYEREFSGIKKFEPISRSHEGFGETMNPEIAERTAMVCLILPSSGVDLEVVGKLAELARVRAKKHPLLPISSPQRR